MLNKTYKILKYIHKNPKIKKSDLLMKFSDFEKYQNCISEYVIVTDDNINLEKVEEETLIIEANQLGLSIGETSDYIKNNKARTENSINNSLILYSTNLNFNEYFEKKKHDAWLFWFPYTLTTFIAIASLIAQFL